MHHALLLPDVLDHIFTFIKADRQISDRTFAALARTCGALSEASLDALWSELRSLYPLVSCIHDTKMTSSDEQTAEADTDAVPDLSAFHKYAYRVRKLELSGYRVGWTSVAWATSVADDLGVFHVLQVPTPLLPNLIHLIWPCGLSLALLWPLLHPRLLSLHIPSFQWSPASTPLLLPEIRRRCPELTSLTAICYSSQGFPYQGVADNRLCQVICSWKKLEVLDCNPVGCECILNLSALPSLRVLRLRVGNSSNLDLPANSLSFPSLNTFHLEADTLGAYDILQAMRSLPKFIEVDLLVRKFGNADYGQETVELILDPIDQNTSCDKLEELIMSVPDFQSGGIINGYNVLQPLFLCSNLRALRIMLTPQFMLGDNDLCTMAFAWPRLEELELYHTPYRTLPSPSSHFMGLPSPPVPASPPLHPIAVQTVPQGSLIPQLPITAPSLFPEFDARSAGITFQGLISLLILCPNLRFFNLTIDATKLDGLQGDKPGGGVCNRLVKCPRLVDSSINDPEEVARILLDILPELETICGEGSHFPTTFNEILPLEWFRVQARVLASKAARGLAT